MPLPPDHTPADAGRSGEWVAYNGVTIGVNVTIQPYVILGVPPRDVPSDELITVIGDGAHIRSHTVIYAGVRIGRTLETGHGVLIRELTSIGDDVSIGSHSVIEHHVTIGDRVRVHSQAFVPELSILEDDCWIGPHVAITNAKYPALPDTKEHLQGLVIRRKACVGANVTLLPGVEIGAAALVGAGSVVTKNVPPNAVVAGNPASILRYL